MILKFALFLCIAVIGSEAAQLRFANAQMHPAAVLGLGTESGLQVETIAVGSYDDPTPMSSYLQLPWGRFALYKPLSFYAYDAWNQNSPVRVGLPLNVTLVDYQSYTFVAIYQSADNEAYTPLSRVLFVVEERPTTYIPYGKALLKIVNAVAASNGQTLPIDILSMSNTRIEVPFASSTNFIEFTSVTEVRLRVYFPTRTADFTVLLQRNATTVLYLRGDIGPSAGYHGSASIVPFGSPPPSVPVPPAVECINGVVETTGVCNCYSGYQDDPSNTYLKCSIPPPNNCLPLPINNSSMDIVSVPSLVNLSISTGKLAFSIVSGLVANRRTLIELPDPKCNFISSPSYYSKHVDECSDIINSWIPFADCGFAKSSQPDQDLYRGTIVVEQIDRVAIGETTMDSTVDTPFTILIRVPTNIAVQSTVEVIAPPVFNVPISAVLIGQRTNAQTRSAVLQYATSLPAPMAIQSARLFDAPYGITATLRLSDINCTGISACIQQLEMSISNISTCSISGVYRVVITVSCRSQQDCPVQLKANTVDAILQSTILAQNLCSEASVDVRLQGTLQAYSDPDFTNQVLSLSNGQSVYFVVDTYSSEASISRVTITDVYYYGPNILGRYLMSNGNISMLAVANHFHTGSKYNSQAWFSIDVSVSAPNSSEDKIFTLNNDQKGVYSFIAFADVEWQLANSTSGPKRVVLQNSLSQSSQFTTQVEITHSNDAAPTDSEVSSSVFVSFSFFALLSLVTILLI